MSYEFLLHFWWIYDVDFYFTRQWVVIGAMTDGGTLHCWVQFWARERERVVISQNQAFCSVHVNSRKEHSCWCFVFIFFRISQCFVYCFLHLGLLFILLVLLLLFQEGRSLQHFLLLLLLGTEDRVRIVSPAGIGLAFRESSVAISVCLVGCVFTFK